MTHAIDHALSRAALHGLAIDLEPQVLSQIFTSAELCHQGRA